MRLLVVEDEQSLREGIAKKLRLSGYEVDACDFLVKPVTYPEFALKFTRILSKVPSEAASGDAYWECAPAARAPVRAAAPG